MYKNMNWVVFVILSFISSVAMTYVVDESLFEVVTHVASNGHVYNECNELRTDGRPSKVRMVNGKRDFEELVVKASKIKPVVIKVFSLDSQLCKETQGMFQDIADELEQDVMCVSLNLFDRYGSSMQNYTMIKELMASFVTPGELQVSFHFPTFFLYKNGKFLAKNGKIERICEKQKLCDEIKLRLQEA